MYTIRFIPFEWDYYLDLSPYSLEKASNSKTYILNFSIDVEHYVHRHHVKQINVRVFMRNLVIPVMQTIHK